MTPAAEELAREAMEDPPARRARERLPWLLLGLLGSTIVTAVMASAHQLLERDLRIAYFVPAIVYLADAIGTQTEAVAVRGLAATHRPIRELLGSEVWTGLLIGGALGVCAVPIVQLVFGDVRLAIAVGLAIVAAGSIATALGLALPWWLSRNGLDPAFASGPIATILQDLLSLLIYLGFAFLLVR